MTSTPRRAYNSTKRHEDASSTKRAILDAAFDLFARDGYANVTVAQVAARATVSLRTVYSSVGGKVDLLTAVIGRAEAESGGEEAIEYITSLDDPSAVLAALAEGTRAGNEKSQLVFEIARTAAITPEAREIRKKLITRYAELLDVTAQHLAGLDSLPHDVSSREASEILWFCFGVDAWITVTQDLGKSWDEAERWLLQRARTLLSR